MWLSGNDTYNWARKPHAAWPCSQASGHRLMIQVDTNGLCDFTMDGHSADMAGDELDAIVADHLPTNLHHLWPIWHTA